MEIVVKLSSFSGSCNSFCPDCHQGLDWDACHAGDLDVGYWLAYCACEDGTRLWKMEIESVKISPMAPILPMLSELS